MTRPLAVAALVVLVACFTARPVPTLVFVWATMVVSLSAGLMWTAWWAAVLAAEKERGE